MKTIDSFLHSKSIRFNEWISKNIICSERERDNFPLSSSFFFSNRIILSRFNWIKQKCQKWHSQTSLIDIWWKPVVSLLFCSLHRSMRISSTTNLISIAHFSITDFLHYSLHSIATKPNLSFEFLLTAKTRIWLYTTLPSNDENLLRFHLCFLFILDIWKFKYYLTWSHTSDTFIIPERRRRKIIYPRVNNRIRFSHKLSVEHFVRKIEDKKKVFPSRNEEYLIDNQLFNDD